MNKNGDLCKSYGIKSKGDINLSLKIYESDEGFDKILVITHGYGEHQGYYEDFAKYFMKKGFAVCTYDLRSHGKSGGKQGHVPSFELFLDDLENIIGFAQNQLGALPVYLFGHSMGGSIVLNYLLRRTPENVNKAIISSPWLKLAFEPPRLKLILANIGKKLFPSLVMKGELDIYSLSRNPDFVSRFINDPLTYDKISPGYFSTIREYGLYALANANKLRNKVLMSHGSDDKVTSSQASKEFCENTGEYCTYKLVYSFITIIINGGGEEPSS